MTSDEGQPGDQEPPGMPRWVKGLLLGVLVLAALMVVLHILNGGQGPVSHLGLGDEVTVVVPLA